MRTHEETVQRICIQAKARAAAGAPVKIVKDAVSHFVPDPTAKEDLPKIDLRGLNRVLAIDAVERTCIAEAGVTFEKLVRATLAHGLVPVCVPELKGITVGGAISGCSIESMSYKHGGFHDSCLEYEVVTGAGEVIICSPQEDPELFEMIHGSYGTLGILTKVSFKLIQAPPYVQLRYMQFSTFLEFEAEMKRQMARPGVDFIDGIIHAKDLFVLCLGNFVYEAPYSSDYSWLSIYYRSTEDLEEDYMRTEDYFFRYDTECHWLTKTVPGMSWWPVRLLLGKLVLGSTNLIKWSKRLKSIMKLKRRPEVVVDVFIPAGRFGEFYEWYEREFDFYPLWIVPYRAPKLYPWIDPVYGAAIGGSLFIDCAVYGKKNSRKDVDFSEVLEKKTFELGGIKTLISRNHFDEATFWRVYNKPLYDKVKAAVDPKGLFLNLFEKFRPKEPR